jgi:hypothetical protein
MFKTPHITIGNACNASNDKITGNVDVTLRNVGSKTTTVGNGDPKTRTEHNQNFNFSLIKLASIGCKIKPDLALIYCHMFGKFNGERYEMKVKSSK